MYEVIIEQAYMANPGKMIHHGVVEYAKYIYQFNGEYSYKFDRLPGNYYGWIWTFENPVDATFFKVKFAGAAYD